MDETDYGPIPDKGEFCVYGIVHCKPEFSDRLSTLYAKMSRLAKTEPGVIHYCLSRNTRDKDVFHFFERYASKEDFERHVQREESQMILREGWFERVEARFERPL